MEALISSSPKIFAENYTNRAYLSSRTVSCSPQIRLFRAQKLLSVGLPLPLRFKPIESLAFSCFSSKSQGSWETADDQTQASQAKLVHVKFRLQKECMFGQRFLLVGGDPIFGSWDPSNAIPMEWSHGHIWTVELDLPVGKTVQFKFILQGTRGEITWQAGADRLVQTWETENTIVVSEDWENAELQRLTEEAMINPIMEPVDTKGIPNPNVEGVDNVNKGLIVAENISCPKDEPIGSASGELIASEYNNPKADPGVTADIALGVAENINHPKEYTADFDRELQTTEKIAPSQQENSSSADKELIIPQSTPQINGEVICSKDENLAIIAGLPVLVPGLTPLPTITIQEFEVLFALIPHLFPYLVEKDNKTDAPVQAGEADGNSTTELLQKQEPDDGTCQEEKTMMKSNQLEVDLHVDGFEIKSEITIEQESRSQPIDGQDKDGNILEDKDGSILDNDIQTDGEDKDGNVLGNDIQTDVEDKDGKLLDNDIQTAGEEKDGNVLGNDIQTDGEDKDVNIVDNDIQWTYNTVLKILSVLGFRKFH